MKNTKRILSLVLSVVLVFGVGLQMDDDLGTDGSVVALLNGVAVNALGFPHVCGLSPDSTAAYGDLIRYHERGVETDSELTYDGNVFWLFIVLLEVT